MIGFLRGQLVHKDPPHLVVEVNGVGYDGDGLKNWQEDVWGSDRNDKDSNDDGIWDGASVLRGIDPA